MGKYDLKDLIFEATIGFLVGFIFAGIFTLFMNINHSSNTDLLCGILSDNSISNSTVITICSERK
jgi:hypothetical protein